ncbi:MAG: aminotransferase class V-fold PLP-dependent enzyme, partial [Syntrophaceae bacterium]|nr:aminotransferase class V-fold PLP-dependent enzyme [Syntrophaceae bacterium]
MLVYLDCNATTPVEPRVRDKILHFLDQEFGNAASRTHVWGARAKQAVQHAREQVAAVVDSKIDEVIFTSGATEGNNMAILGIIAHAERTGKRHIISTKMEHKAVLEPLSVLEKKGFEVTLLSPNAGGRININEFEAALRPETVMVSVMHVNNETGVTQPIEEIAESLDGHDAVFHVDAAQGFGKEITSLRNKRI